MIFSSKYPGKIEGMVGFWGDVLWVLNDRRGVDLLYMVFGEMLYGCGVVGGVVNYINDIYGARTSLFLTSQRMPGATPLTHAYIIG